MLSGLTRVFVAYYIITVVSLAKAYFVITYMEHCAHGADVLRSASQSAALGGQCMTGRVAYGLLRPFV